MSASTIDRLLREPRSATRLRKARRAMPAARRRVPVRTFADWNEPPPGSMEMDLVAHCGEANRGSYVHSLWAASGRRGPPRSAADRKQRLAPDDLLNSR